ncbi:MAG: glycoside hydrolase family 55 protein [Phycisphaerae bacterium]
MRHRLTLAVLLAIGQVALAENMVFPADSGIVDVKARYGAKGDGVTDDTRAIQKAVDEVKGLPGTLYFPDGTYLVSDTLSQGGVPHSRDRFLVFQGQSEAGTVIRLKDNCPGFTDSAKPKVVLSVYDGKSTGDTMHGYVRNLSVNVGSGNPGAVGLRFMANNTGGMYHVTIRSGDPRGRGKIGLDLRQSQIGPCLIKHVTVIGFDRGVETHNSFAIVLEHLTLKRQNVLGFDNVIARVTMRGLKSVNAVPALRNGRHAHMTLIEADLSGGGSDNTAIISEDPKLFVRDVRQSGYGHLLRDASGKTHDAAALDEWCEGKAKSLFPCDLKTLRLPIKETPEAPWETDLSKWEKVAWSPGADATAALQAAFDRAAKEGRTTVYIPRLAGTRKYPKVTGPVRVHGSVNRIVGMESIVDVADPAGRFKAGEALFTFEDLTSEPLVVERFFLLGGWKCPADVCMFANKSGKAIVIRNVNHAGMHKKPCPGGEWFIEDVSPSRTGTLLIGPGEKCWARQLNPESPEVDMIEVDGGQLWILGLKTEGRSRHIVARNGAKVELLGGVSYQSWGKQPLDPPMFTVVDSDASFTFGFYHWNLPFTTIVEETVAGKTRSLPRKELTGYHLPIYRAGGGAARKGSN